MKTTLKAIRTHRPCADGWGKLLRHLGKTKADDEPVRIATIVQSNGLSDAQWCLRAVKGHDREIRFYAVWCARQVQHLMMDPRSIYALDVAERFARDEASADEWAMAKKAARAASRVGLASYAAWMALKNNRPALAAASAAAVAFAAVSDSSSTELRVPNMTAAVSAQRDELLRLCAEIEAREDAK